MKDHYTAILKKKGDWWIGWIEEVPGVNCQERSKEELIETLRITLGEALAFNRKEALEAAGESYEEKDIACYEALRVASASPSSWMSAIAGGKSAFLAA